MSGSHAPAVGRQPAVGGLPGELPAAPRSPRRLVYLGTPQMAVAPLEALVAAGFEVALVVTRVDKRRGRGGNVSPSPVKAAAERLGIPVSHRVDEVLAIAAERPVDLGVVVAFGQLIKPHVLAAVPMVNLHFSLLPRWRGAAPVERALLAGEEVTGVCLMRVEEGLDTGGVYARVEVPIGPGATADDLRGELVAAGTELLVASFMSGLGAPVAQAGTVTYAAKIIPSELQIDWARPADGIDRLVRLGGAWTTFRGKRLKVIAARPAEVAGAFGAAFAAGSVSPEPGRLDGARVAGGDGWLELFTVQPEGRGPMDARSWLNGARPQSGERLG